MSEKICGNCKNIVRLSPREIPKEEACYVCYHVRELSKGSYPVFPLVLYDDCACDKWIDGTAGHALDRIFAELDERKQLKQRYEQLEQVAKELYKELEKVTDKRLNRRTRDDLLYVYFSKLYALGVSLDD